MFHHKNQPDSHSQLYVGIMSGTSLDGIDAVLVDFESDPHTVKVLCTHAHPLPASLRAQIQQLCDAQVPTNEINLMGQVDRQLGYLFAEAVNTLCAKAGVNAQQISAIGNHGQTIRHYPNGDLGFSLQIGDANTLAVTTGIDVIADFRKKDLALGGQGAPLVPSFHHALFAHPTIDRIIVNIGGMANLTYLPALSSTLSTQSTHSVIGYDSGPGNTLIDRWCQHHQNQPYDRDGQWARSGKLDHALLNQLLADDYFTQPAPKSTGREKFNLAWLDHVLTHLATDDQNICPADIQHTLVHLTASSIAQQIMAIGSAQEIYLCGGGSHNCLLVETLASYLPSNAAKPLIANTAALGVEPDWVEAIAFAWLARRFIHQQPGNLPSVTGASRPAILGCFYPSN